MKKIVFPTDYSEAYEKALKVVKYLANKSTETIPLLHTYKITATMYAHVKTIITPHVLEYIKSSGKNQNSA